MSSFAEYMYGRAYCPRCHREVNRVMGPEGPSREPCRRCDQAEWLKYPETQEQHTTPDTERGGKDGEG